MDDPVSDGAVCAWTYGIAEKTLAFYVLLIPVMIAAGYDTVVAVAVILLGAGIGVLGSSLFQRNRV